MTAVAALGALVVGLAGAAGVRSCRPARTEHPWAFDELARRAAAGDAAGSRTLHRALTGGGPERRRIAALQAIGRQRATSLAPSVLAAVAGGRVPAAAAVVALAQLGPAVVPVLEHACGDPDPVTRAVAVRVLGRVGGPVARWTVLGGMADEAAVVRRAAAASARDLGLAAGAA